jgi:DNA polymerase III subunit delta'
MVFDDIVGHSRTLDALRRAVEEDRLHHSLLFHGPDGVGKRRVAFALAAALQCPERPGVGCGTCPSCRRVLKGHENKKLPDRSQVRAEGFHADVLFYPPRRSQIQIDQIHDLRREAGFRPFEGRRRVFLLDPADRMNREASNALLKTLEEPPPSALLVLLTAHPEALLTTLRSRCQDVRFSPLSIGELAGLLESEGRTSAQAARLARLAGGSIGRALGTDLERHDALRERFLLVLESGDSDGGLGVALGCAEQIGADGETFTEAAQVLGSLLRDLALLQREVGPEGLVHTDLGTRLDRLAQRYGDRAPEQMERLDEAVRRVRSNANARLTAEAVLAGLVSGSSA